MLTRCFDYFTSSIKSFLISLSIFVKEPIAYIFGPHSILELISTFSIKGEALVKMIKLLIVTKSSVLFIRISN